jgi:tRNA nucleotidyltransferase (CCA-adding enzyme)
MRIYLVGGAVRDELLGIAAGEKDWVVVGATPEEMLKRGYQPVGKNFPVFLHPDTREEYALARTERKTAPGYHGFVFHADPDVTLEQDLKRRDLTINAIARDDNGTIIDPFGGTEDIRARLLRHVSGAFSEDPVRILRVARFAARFYPQGFSIAEETRELMRQIVVAGELEALVPERVWAETLKALSTAMPSVYFEVLRSCGALGVLFPELDRLWGVPQPARWHPEIDTGVHTMMVLDQAARLADDNQVRFAALVHDLGKGTTPAQMLPSHKGHEARSMELVSQLCERYRIPNQFRDLALIVAEYHGYYHRVAELKPRTILKMLNAIDAFRRPDRFEQFLLACEADARGRTGYEDIQPEQTKQLRACFDAANSVEIQPLIQDKHGKAVKQAINEARVGAISALGLGSSSGKAD